MYFLDSASLNYNKELNPNSVSSPEFVFVCILQTCVYIVGIRFNTSNYREWISCNISAAIVSFVGDTGGRHPLVSTTAEWF